MKCKTSDGVSAALRSSGVVSAANVQFRGGAEGEDAVEETEELQHVDAYGALAVRDDGAAPFYG